MNIITVDDEEFALRALNRAIREAVPNAVLFSFQEADELLKSIEDKKICPDVVFLDIEMPGMNGMELAGRIKMHYPMANLIFVTGFSEYALDAYTLRPSGYLTKPVTKEDIIHELQNLRWGMEYRETAKPVSIHCFGNFEVRLHGETISFSRSKSMEALAYLVSQRGKLVFVKEIANVLWEDGIYDRSRQKQISVIRHDLIKTLEDYGISEILRISKSALAVEPAAFDCDYYRLLAGDGRALNSFSGEFMKKYSWAEEITATLCEKFAI